MRWQFSNARLFEDVPCPPCVPGWPMPGDGLLPVDIPGDGVDAPGEIVDAPGVVEVFPAGGVLVWAMALPIAAAIANAANVLSLLMVIGVPP